MAIDELDAPVIGGTPTAGNVPLEAELIKTVEGEEADAAAVQELVDKAGEEIEAVLEKYGLELRTFTNTRIVQRGS